MFLVQVLVSMCIRSSLNRYFCRYICSAAESQTKSVLSLFNDYMKSWVSYSCLLVACCVLYVTYMKLLSLFIQDKRNPGQPKPRLFTVGRLDVATTGLIIVTNDGSFTVILLFGFVKGRRV